MNLTEVALSALMAAALFFFGGTKIVGAKWTVDNFDVLYRLPPWIRTVTGLVEVSCGALLLAGIVTPGARIGAAILLIPTMLAAIMTEVTRTKMPGRALAPGVLLVGMAALLTLA